MGLVKLAARGDKMIEFAAKHRINTLDLLQKKFGKKKAMNASLQYMANQAERQRNMWGKINEILK
jgi:FtsZ-binding cell division protein ZapB